MTNTVSSITRLVQRREEGARITSRRSGEAARPLTLVALDVDGVILREADVVERCYAWAIRALSTGRADPRNVEVDASDMEAAHQFRRKNRGKSLATKIRALRRAFGNCSRPLGDANLLLAWTDAKKSIVQDLFGQNPASYLLPGARTLLASLSTCFPVWAITSNEDDHARWLLKFVGVESLLSGSKGIRFPPTSASTKKGLLIDLLTETRATAETVCYVGDSAADMEAARSAGTLAMGMIGRKYPPSRLQDSREDACLLEEMLDTTGQLVEAGCDFLATSPLASEEIVQHLSSWGSTR